jgi:hypothetical protein
MVVPAVGDGIRILDNRGVVGSSMVSTEFCVKVLKVEIVHSWNLFNYFIRVVPITIEFFKYVMLSLIGLKIGFKMACFKIDRMTFNLQVKIRDCGVLVVPTHRAH